MLVLFSCHYNSLLTIASVLHPGLKLEYFQQKKWEDEWIENAKDLVREVYVAHYEAGDDPAAATSAEHVCLSLSLSL